MGHPIALRPATIGDVAGIVALLNAAFAMEWDFINRARTSPPEIEQYMTTGTFLVLDGDGGAIGACMYLEQRASRLYLGMLAVSPAMQGRGVGKQMMTAAERHAASLGCEAIDIRIVNRRTELPPFYRALGFIDNGTEPFEEPLLTKPCHFIRMTKKVGQGR
jgi:N-acetylglutamate synthase-like GNAT family acetyltransferase